MADITGMGFLRHLRADASSHVLLFRGARLRRSGRGLAFWFSPFAVSVAEVPVDDREVALAVHGRSADFQDVVVQGSVTFRIVNPELTAARVDFSIDQRRGTYLRQPLEKLALMLTQLAQQRAQSYVKDAALREVVVRGHDGLRTAIEQGLANAPMLTDLGLEIVAVRIASVKPAPEVERALEALTRERIQEEADEAIFRRRAQAVDKERAIQENEMQNQIELAKREQQLIDQRGQNAPPGGHRGRRRPRGSTARPRPDGRAWPLKHRPPASGRSKGRARHSRRSAWTLIGRCRRPSLRGWPLRNWPASCSGSTTSTSRPSCWGRYWPICSRRGPSASAGRTRRPGRRRDDQAKIVHC